MIFNILAPILAAVALSLYLNKKIVYTVPLTICGLILLLNVMAVCGVLNAIDYVSAAVCVLLALLLLRDKDRLKANSHLMWNPSTLVLLGVYCAIGLLYWTSQVANGDDLVYWATCVKSLLYRGSIEPPYRNVSVGFGDYPLGVQLTQWWFMHLAGGWGERWLFIAHNFLTYSFLVPVFADVKRGIHRILAAILLVLILPYTTYGFYDDLSVDSCLAAVFAYAVLLSVRADFQKTRPWEMALVLATLPLIKSVGMLWACFGWVLWMLVTYEDHSRSTFLLKSAAVIAPAVIIWQAWSRFCILWGRSSYLTANLVNRGLQLDEAALEAAKSFFQGIFCVPYVSLFHTGIGLPLAVYLGVMVAVLFVMMKKLPRDRRNGRILGFLALTTAVYLMVLLYSDLTMFVDEASTAAVNARKIGRYSGPMTLAILVVLWDVFLRLSRQSNGHCREKWAAAIAVGLILCLNWNPFCGHVQFRLSGQQMDRTDLMAAYERVKPFFAELEKLEEPQESRVLYFEQAGEDEWNNMAVYYYAEGISVVYASTVSPEDLAIYVRGQDATHVYLAQAGGTAADEFQQLSEAGEVRYNTLYRVDEDASGSMILIAE